MFVLIEDCLLRFVGCYCYCACIFFDFGFVNLFVIDCFSRFYCVRCTFVGCVLLGESLKISR